MSQPYKTLLTIDWETKWSSSDYTLSKMTTEAYIRDPRFHAYGLCIHEYGTDKMTQWYSHKEVKHILSMYDWSKTAVLAHNSLFDVGILSMIYGVQPCFVFDSLSMARALRGVEVGNSLAKLAMAFDLPPKGRAVHSTDGIEEITPEIERELAEYCKHDVFLCEEIFTRLRTGLHGGGRIAPAFPTKELRLIDLTLKMFTNPQLVLDVPMLEKARDEENEKLRAALERVGVEESQLASNDQFAEILEKMGVTPPTKKKRPTQKTPNPVGENFAFAKNDAHFQQMLNGDNEDVALLCEARLRVKSTLERTRSQRFIDIAGRGALPIPLKYYGAETGRWSGTDQVNLQNMKRGSFLRKSIMAPEGYVVAVQDLGQIEPRVLAWVSDYHNMTEIFRAGGDPYATFGAQMFSIPGLHKDTHPIERQSAKSALLGAGFQLGWAAFSAQLLVGFLGADPKRYTKEEARQLGVTSAHVERFINNKWHMEKMAEIPRTCTDAELLIHCLAAKEIIEKYRRAAEPVVQFWKMLQERIVTSLIGGEEYNHKGVFTIKKEEIVLVNGMSLKYPNIEICKDERGHTEYRFGIGDKKGKLYAGRLCIGEGTPVLTARGWVPIEEVQTYDWVHDGIDFVHHSGIIAKGVQGCITVDGVYMTPDHEVLTNDGWKKASQLPKPYRPSIRNAYCDTTGSHGRGKVVLGVQVPVWEKMCALWAGRNKGLEERTHRELRMHDENIHRTEEHHTRNDPQSPVGSLAKYAHALHESATRSVQKLRCAGYQCLQALAEQLSKLHGRHGQYLYSGAGLGPQEQRGGLHAKELSMGNAPRERDEQTQHGAYSGCGLAFGTDRYRSHDAVQPDKSGLACGAANAQTGVQQPTYDIGDCGPRNRFVVMGSEGPFIVHNCNNIVQALARIVMSDGMLRIAKRYDVVGTVHDEVLALVPEQEAKEGLLWMKEQMVLEPKWLPGIPLKSDGGFHKRYGEAKT